MVAEHVGGDHDGLPPVEVDDVLVRADVVLDHGDGDLVAQLAVLAIALPGLRELQLLGRGVPMSELPPLPVAVHGVLAAAPSRDLGVGMEEA